MRGRCQYGKRDERATAKHIATVARRGCSVFRPGVAGLSYTSIVRPRDTDEKAEQVQLGIYRRMSGSERLRLAMQMSDASRATSMAGIRARHPDYTADQVRFALFRLLHGDELFRRAWPPAPLLAP